MSVIIFIIIISHRCDDNFYCCLVSIPTHAQGSENGSLFNVTAVTSFPQAVSLGPSSESYFSAERTDSVLFNSEWGLLLVDVFLDKNGR